MGLQKDKMIEREEIERNARGKCWCGEWLQQGEDEECSRHAWEAEHS